MYNLLLVLLLLLLPLLLLLLLLLMLLLLPLLLLLVLLPLLLLLAAAAAAAAAAGRNSAAMVRSVRGSSSPTQLCVFRLAFLWFPPRLRAQCLRGCPSRALAAGSWASDAMPKKFSAKAKARPNASEDAKLQQSMVECLAAMNKKIEAKKKKNRQMEPIDLTGAKEEGSKTGRKKKGRKKGSKTGRKKKSEEASAPPTEPPKTLSEEIWEEIKSKRKKKKRRRSRGAATGNPKEKVQQRDASESD